MLEVSLTRPIKGDGNTTGEDRFIVRMIAIRLTNHQLVREILPKMHHAPHFAPFRRLYGVR